MLPALSTDFVEKANVADVVELRRHTSLYTEKAAPSILPPFLNRKIFGAVSVTVGVCKRHSVASSS